MQVCNLPSYEFQALHGELGLAGRLGYEDLLISVKSRFFNNSVSFHPPGQVSFETDGKYEFFHSLIGFNDTSYPGTRADFLVFADDILVAAACDVKSEEMPREIFANINGAKKIKLVIETENPPGCHALWANPVLHLEKQSLFPGVLGRAHGKVPDKLAVCEKCIFTTLTPSYVPLLDDMLGSLYLNGQCKDAHIFIFVLNADEKCSKLAQKYNATLIPITTEHTSTLMLKSLVYSIASFVVADYYLMLDADMFILDSIKPLFETIKSTNEKNILVSREYNIPLDATLGYLLSNDVHPYYCGPNDIHYLRVGEEANCNFIVNGGVIGGTRKAWLSLDSAMRSYMPNSAAWDSFKIADGLTWREQAIFNLAIAKTGRYTELNPLYNVQLLFARPEIKAQDKFVVAYDRNKLVSILHFNGEPGKDIYKQLSGKYSHMSDTKFGEHSAQDIYSHSNFLQSAFQVIKNKIQLRTIYPDIDHIKNYTQLHKFIYDACTDIDMCRVLELGCRAGLLSNYIGASCELNNGHLVTVEMNTPEEYYSFVKDTPNITHINGDVLVYLKDSEDFFDIIICNTQANLRHVCSQLILAMKRVDEFGSVYLIDNKFPTCDILSVKKKLNGNNLDLLPSNIKNLYIVQNKEDK